MTDVLPITIRYAQADDIASVVAIYNQSIPTKQATAELTPVTIADKQDWFDGHIHRQATRPMLVAVKDNQVVGWGGFTDLYSREAYNISSEVSIYIDEQAKGQGMGKALLLKLLALAPSLGIQQVVAKIFAHNQPSLQLFDKMGFESWGVLRQVCDMDGFIADVAILGKSVSNADADKGNE